MFVFARNRYGAMAKNWYSVESGYSRLSVRGFLYLDSQLICQIGLVNCALVTDIAVSYLQIVWLLKQISLSPNIEQATSIVS